MSLLNCCIRNVYECVTQMLSAVIGIILLPIYFISVLLFYVYKRGPKKKK